MTEFELIQGLRNGDESAFRYLVDTYQNRVFNTAMGIVQNAEDAEDVAQEVFIQVFRSIGSFKAESKLSTWIYRITTTRSLDLLRSRKSKNASALFSGSWVKTTNQPRTFLILIIPGWNWTGKKMPPGYLKSLENCRKIRKLHLPYINWKTLVIRKLAR